jgi:GrpB-like predicted nucleotidyltransferase (UPF0157 family)
VGQQHLYLVVEGSQAWINHVRWRDLLRGDGALALRYEKLKRHLAETYQTDREGYTNAKTDFIVTAMSRNY